MKVTRAAARWASESIFRPTHVTEQHLLYMSERGPALTMLF